MTRWFLLALLVLPASWPAHARAQTQVFPVANSPVVRIQMASGRVRIKTWDRPAVQVESNVSVRARHFGPLAVANALPAELTIPSSTVRTKNGPAFLPEEVFAIGPVLNAPHDGVVIFGGKRDARVTLTIPNDTALVWALVGRGGIAMQGYRGGTFVTLVRAGQIRLQNVSGDAYAEAVRGMLFIQHAAFNRIRARTALGNIIFENCNVRQVEASSVSGSIVYDNGTFVPGIARFESLGGNVAIGIAGGNARIDAHSPQGRIFSGFVRGAAMSGSPTDAQAIVGSGGPIVTVNSQRGAVYLYDGSLRSHGRLQGAWQPIGRLIGPLEQKFPHRRHI